MHLRYIRPASLYPSHSSSYLDVLVNVFAKYIQKLPVDVIHGREDRYPYPKQQTTIPACIQLLHTAAPPRTTSGGGSVYTLLVGVVAAASVVSIYSFGQMKVTFVHEPTSNFFLSATPLGLF